jgi:hypothetical protein
LFGQFGEDEETRGPCGDLEYYLVVACCSFLVFAFATWDVSEEVIDFVTESLGSHDVLALKGGHTCEDFEVCDNGICGV